MGRDFDEYLKKLMTKKTINTEEWVYRCKQLDKAQSAYADTQSAEYLKALLFAQKKLHEAEQTLFRLAKC